MAVYLLHFDRPYRHARHYLGYTPGTIQKRVNLHRSGNGARLMRVIKDAGYRIYNSANMAWRHKGRREEDEEQKECSRHMSNMPGGKSKEEMDEQGRNGGETIRY